jgi:ABC-type enterochelin transport system permease subunit
MPIGLALGVVGSVLFLAILASIVRAKRHKKKLSIP